MAGLSLRRCVFPAAAVPRDSEGRIHRRAHEGYVDWMAGQGVDGVAVWAHTGRGLRLTDAERIEVLSLWRATFADGRLVIAAAGSTADDRRPDAAIASARSMAVLAVDHGADALLVHPPTAFRGRPDVDRLVLDYHAAIAEAGRPLILFHLYEAAGGVSYAPHVLAQLLARPEILGIKVATLDGVMTYQQIAALVREVAPSKTVVTGEDRFLGYSLMAGGDAALIGMAAACTRFQVDFLRSYWNGDAAGFLAGNAAIDDLARHTFIAPMEGYIQRMLWCLVHQGVIPLDAAHDPWGPKLGAREFDEIGACLARIGQFSPRAEP